MNINLLYGQYFNDALFEFVFHLNTSADYYINLKKLLEIKKVKNYPLIRIGHQESDGGYIMLGNFNPCNKIAYSFGICNDVSWDDYMSMLGYDIYMYDFSIDNLPYEKENFHFFKEGISAYNEINSPLKTLNYFLSQNKHSRKNNMILKMDVEGAEWGFLETVSEKTLKRFDQIVFEFHNIVQADNGEYILTLLEKLNKTHQLIHLHANNSGMILQVGNTYFPDVLEASYILKDNYEFEEDSEYMLPLPIDAPNDIGRPDVILGKWNKPLILNID